MTDPREHEPDPPDYEPPEMDDDWETLAEWQAGQIDRAWVEEMYG